MVKLEHFPFTCLSTHYYNWRVDQFPEMNFGSRRELGVIAQKVEKVFPEAVSKDNQGFRSVAYSMLIAPIIESIKELKLWLLGHDKSENAFPYQLMAGKKVSDKVAEVSFFPI